MTNNTLQPALLVFSHLHETPLLKLANHTASYRNLSNRDKTQSSELRKISETTNRIKKETKIVIIFQLNSVSSICAPLTLELFHRVYLVKLFF